MRLLLVDDHPLFLEGLRNLLMARGLTVVGTARDGFEAIERARAWRPDIVIMDIQMPGCDGLTATRLIKAEMPEIKVVILSISENDDDLFEALRAGASGYLVKSVDANKFFDLLLGLEQGNAPLSPGLSAKVLAEFAREGASRRATQQGHLADEPDLTPRQEEILQMMASGLTYKEIGAALNIGERTVKYHVSRILDRLHLHSRAQAIAYAASRQSHNS